MKKSHDIFGVILIGGQSTRFGSPKGNVCINNTPQWMRLLDMLTHICKDVFFSMHDSLQEVYDDIPKDKILYDKHIAPLKTKGVGPMGGLCTVMEELHAPCLFLSIDWFLMEHNTLSYLCEQHHTHYDVTAYMFEKMQVLCAIYEPSVLPHLQQAMREKEYSIYRLLQSDAIQCKLVNPINDDMKKSLTRINEKRDLEVQLDIGCT